MFVSGLPDFSWYSIQKREKYTKMAIKYTKSDGFRSGLPDGIVRCISKIPILVYFEIRYMYFVVKWYRFGILHQDLSGKTGLVPVE
jgi:hypothetical protein